MYGKSLSGKADIRVDYLALPDVIKFGRYDRYGRSAPGGRCFITPAGTAFIWGVFEFKLEPSQQGEMNFTNIPGSFLVGTSFTEWDEKTNLPTITDALLTFIAIQRGDGNIRVVGRNVSNRPIIAAAGIVIGDGAPY